MDGYRLFRKDSYGEELPFEVRAAGMHELCLRMDEEPAESQVTSSRQTSMVSCCSSCLLQTTCSENEAGIFFRQTVHIISGLLFYK